MVKIAIIGQGKFGKAIEKQAQALGVDVGSKESSDCWIHSSHGSQVLKDAQQALSLKKPLVIGTTAWEEDREAVIELSKQIPILFAPNFSLYTQLYIQAATKLIRQVIHSPLLAPCSYQIEETHHIEKKDSPSGTALKMKAEMEKQGGQVVSVCSKREGQVVGEHELIIDTPFEQIRFKHQAKNREGFAQGALVAGLWLYKQKPGWYKLEDLFNEEFS